MDAVRAVRIPPLFRFNRDAGLSTRRAMAAADGCGRCADRAEPVVHVLPDVLLAVRCGVRALGNLASRAVDEAPAVAATCRCSGPRHGADRTAVAAVRRGTR